MTYLCLYGRRKRAESFFLLCVCVLLTMAPTTTVLPMIKLLSATTYGTPVLWKALLQKIWRDIKRHPSNRLQIPSNIYASGNKIYLSVDFFPISLAPVCLPSSGGSRGCMSLRMAHLWCSNHVGKLIFIIRSFRLFRNTSWLTGSHISLGVVAMLI